MMVNIYFGKTSDDCLDSLIESIRLNGGKHHVFVVPDRMSVLCEKRIFEVLNLESTCNIEVLTLSRLSSRLLKDKKSISKSTSCMIMQKLLKENKTKLKCFNKNQDADLAQTIYGTIIQFKSCKINFDDVSVKGKNSLLEDKLDDISLLYKAYQTELMEKGLYDNLDKLNFLEEAISKSDFVSSSNFYISHFDGFTFQGYEIMSAICKYAKNFSIGLPFTDSPINEHIYDLNYYENILNLLKPYSPKVIFCKDKRKGLFKFLQDNLFAFNPNSIRVKESNIELFEGKDFEQECINCASTIKNLIAKEGYDFKDIFIAIPNLNQNEDKINQVFSKYDFKFFIDSTKEFSSSLVAKFIKHTFDIIIENFSKSSILSFLKNPLLGLSCEALDDFEDYLLKHNLDDFYEIKSSQSENDTFFENFNIIRHYLFTIIGDFKNQIEGARTFNDFIESYKNLFDKINLEERLNDFITMFSKENDLKQARIFEQYYDILQETFTALSEVLGNEECDFKIFYSTLFSGFKATNVSIAPLSVNAIFIGDSSTSFYENRKIGFVLGASEQDFPKTKLDCGIISDSDIDALSDKYKLEPSITEINKKERFKAYTLLLKPKERLYLSYNYARGEKSRILEDISKMISLEKDGKFNVLPFNSFSEVDFFTRNNSLEECKMNLVGRLRDYCDGQRELDEYDSSLYEVLKDKLDNGFLKRFNFKNKIRLQSNIFFSKGTVSVSQIESFMSCPFVHFARYGLKLNSKEEGELDRLNIGKILHEVGEKLLKKITLPIDESLLKKECEKIFENIISRDEYLYLKSNPSNKILISNLKKEAINFAFALNNQAKHSKFKPTYFEARFDDNRKIKSLKIRYRDKVLSLIGQVDRIDIFEDFFRIIDYKTGNTSTSLKELFFGKKVQLQAYAKVVENSLKLKPAGVYYFPIKNKFATATESLDQSFRLQGRTVDDFNVINYSDDHFEEGSLDSDIVEVKFKKNEEGVRENSTYSKVISPRAFENACSYAISLIEKACDDISTLDITPCPLSLSDSDDCGNCKFFALCRFDENFGNYRRHIKAKITEKNFEEE